MSTVNAPFGFVPDYQTGGGTIRQVRVGSRPAGINGISATDSNVIYFGSLVKFTTAGVITRAASTDAAVAGVFVGAEYDDSTGRHQVKHWDAPTSATSIVAYIVRDPDVLYKVQADGAIAVSNIGNTANLSNVAGGSSASGQSQQTLATGTLSASASTGQVQIVEIVDSPDNAVGDSFTVVRCKIMGSQFAAAYAAF